MLEIGNTQDLSLNKIGVNQTTGGDHDIVTFLNDSNILLLSPKSSNFIQNIDLNNFISSENLQNFNDISDIVILLLS